MKHNLIWRWWAKALGEKASDCNRESDRIAIIRTFIFLTYLITNAFIIAGVCRHWNTNQPTIIYYEVPSSLSETKKESIFKTSGYIL
jgi:hypothetical protein